MGEGKAPRQDRAELATLSAAGFSHAAQLRHLGFQCCTIYVSLGHWGAVQTGLSLFLGAVEPADVQEESGLIGAGLRWDISHSSWTLHMR
jgi:hypothetical protein